MPVTYPIKSGAASNLISCSRLRLLGYFAKLTFLQPPASVHIFPFSAHVPQLLREGFSFAIERAARQEVGVVIEGAVTDHGKICLSHEIKCLSISQLSREVNFSPLRTENSQ